MSILNLHPLFVCPTDIKQWICNQSERRPNYNEMTFSDGHSTISSSLFWLLANVLDIETKLSKNSQKHHKSRVPDSRWKAVKSYHRKTCLHRLVVILRLSSLFNVHSLLVPHVRCLLFTNQCLLLLSKVAILFSSFFGCAWLLFFGAVPTSQTTDRLFLFIIFQPFGHLFFIPLPVLCVVDPIVNQPTCRLDPIWEFEIVGHPRSHIYVIRFEGHLDPIVWFSVSIKRRHLLPYHHQNIVYSCWMIIKLFSSFKKKKI